MVSIKNLLFTLFSILGLLICSAQDCQLVETDKFVHERTIIPGTTMGQKLESLLFWSQDEKESRFPAMQYIFPSIQVSKSSQPFPLKQGGSISPQWKDRTTLTSYMDSNRIKGIIVLQDGNIKLEKYADGIDEKTLWTSFSMAKSVSSMLLGVALKEGDIKNMDDRLERYIPEFLGHDYGKVTVRQLLTMTSGIAWNEDYEDPNSDVAQMYQQPCVNREDHILTYMKPLKFVYEPGTHWNYSTGETDLVGILIQKATGKSLSEYLSEKIWQPFGMEHCAYWLADECSNLNIGGSGLSASLRDYSRLGLLMLNRDVQDEKNIFSKEWLDDATSLLYPVNDQGDGYGYLWWRFKDGNYAAVGIFGQMIYVNPDKNLVIAQIAAWPHAGSKELGHGRQAFINAVLNALD
ncbi:class C beta-lactamase-related serine hydrolase [Aequorivita sp. H23M31]|uniref:Class C beta-lactamase-related serine hydrolase n=1 Tax=Aequorivita ciconiae TaxID=2494375 RepID=A0A410G1W4_9FLAO|nr:class C beta-lactamase-related serine hydrolase [Aequorivita sp. H23M31]